MSASLFITSVAIADLSASLLVVWFTSWRLEKWILIFLSQFWFTVRLYLKQYRNGTSSVYADARSMRNSEWLTGLAVCWSLLGSSPSSFVPRDGTTWIQKVGHRGLPRSRIFGNRNRCYQSDFLWFGNKLSSWMWNGHLDYSLSRRYPCLVWINLQVIVNERKFSKTRIRMLKLFGNAWKLC